jgi:hypothetical protein
VTDDDVRALAITAGSEREPIVGRRAGNSSNSKAWTEIIVVATARRAIRWMFMAGDIGQSVARDFVARACGYDGLHLSCSGIAGPLGDR